MHKMTKLACLVLALTQGAGPAWAAVDNASQVLIEQATYWQQKNRDDLAGDAWRKLLRAEPNHPQALIQLAKIELRAGNVTEAQALYERAARLSPPPVGLTELASSLRMGTVPASELDVARKQAQAGQPDAAVKQYKKALKGERPSGALGLEYYQTLGGTREGWGEARQGLETLAKNHPGDKTYLLALAKHLTYRETTRREGIRQLVALSSDVEADRAWRQALVWLDAKKSDRKLFEEFLARHPEDAGIKSRLASLDRPTRSYRPSAEALARQSGFRSLNQGDLEQAEARFTTILAKHPHDPDALGGMGLIRLRQESFAPAIDYFDQAKRYDRHGRRWTQARNSARYWLLVQQANVARDAGDIGETERDLQSARRIDASEPAATVMLADLLTEQRRYDQAESLYRGVLRRKPNEVNAFAGLLSLLIQTGREREARTMLADYEHSSALQSAGNEQIKSAVLVQMATLDEKNHDYRSAASRLEDALLLDPVNPWIRLSLARQYQKLGYPSEANALLDNLVDAYPDFPEGIHARALLYAEQKGWAEGLRTLERIPPASRTPALKREQRRFWIHAQAQRAQQLFEAKQAAAAQNTMRLVERESGNDKELLAVTATGWSDIGQSDDALRVMRKVMVSYPNSSIDTRIQYAGLLLNGRQYVELGALLRALSAAPERLSVSQQKDLNDIILAYTIRQADSLREGGHLADAYRVLQPALARSDDPRLQMALARLYNTGNEPDTALRITEEVLARNSDDFDNHLFASSMALSVNQNDKALQHAQLALALQPNHPRALAAAGRAEKANGNYDKAMEYFQYAQALEREEAAFDGSSGGLSLRLVDEFPQEERPELLPVPADLTPRRDDLLPVPDVLDRNSLKMSRSVGPHSDASPVAVQPRAARSELPAAFAHTAPSERAPVALAYAENAPVRAPAPQFGEVPATPRRAATVSDEIAAMQSASSDSIIAGAGFRNRTGEAGLSTLSEIEMAAQYDMPMDHGAQLSLRATPVLLSAGTLNSAVPQNAVRFGSVGLGPFLAAPTAATAQNAAGVALNGAYRQGNMTVDLGTTPLGFKVTDFVGGLSLASKVGPGVGVRVGVDRRAVTDSLLSYAGATDPRTGKAWGGVVKTGLGVSADYDRNGKGVYASAAYSALTGSGVMTNNELELSAGAYTKPYRTADMEMTVGVNFSFMSYRHNLSYFTLGHGGYFSPQSYVSAGVPFDLSGRNGDVVYQVGADIGLRAFRADPIAYYPSDPAMQLAWQTQVAALPGYPTQYAGSSVNGLGYGLFGSAEMPVGTQVSVGFKLAMDNSSNYSQQSLMAYLRYSFDHLPQPLSFPPKPLRSIAQGGWL
ncbi:MAG: cellulose synthase subunit BcsC-related outer membrane protein [Gallionella sp.]